MHKTDAGEQRKALRSKALEKLEDANFMRQAAEILPAARIEAERLEAEAAEALNEAEDLKNEARLQDLHLWQEEKTKGGKTYFYWLASWREGDKVRNVHLGSSRKMDAEVAKEKVRKLKAEALGLRTSG